MKTISITRYKCDKCKMVEDVEEGGEPQVSWREVQLDVANKLRGTKEFQFCEKCVGETFGENFISTMNIATSSRHLKSTEAMNDHVEDLTDRTRNLSMELNGGTL